MPGLGRSLSTQWLIAHPVVMELIVTMERDTFYKLITVKGVTVSEGIERNLEGLSHPGK